MIFMANKYTKWYNNIISIAQQKNRKKLKRTDPTYVHYAEHHIIPECFFINRTRKGPSGWVDGNPEISSNKVYLTEREHFVCHWLLTKMVHGKAKASMIFALHGMRRSKYQTKITSRVYANIKEEYSHSMSEELKGRKQSAEIIAKRIKTRTGQTSALKGRPLAEWHKQKVSQSLIGVNLGRPQSEELKARRALIQRGVPKPKTQCPHCDKIGGLPQMKQYHFDKCKTLKEEF